MRRLGISYPILLDQKGVNWDRWGQQYWPTIYLIDRWGLARYAWYGELEYDGAGGEAKMTRLIEELLSEKP